jgi:hypothetical protein
MNRRKGDHFKRIFIYILIVPLDNIDATHCVEGISRHRDSINTDRTRYIISILH